MVQGKGVSITYIVQSLSCQHLQEALSERTENVKISGVNINIRYEDDTVIMAEVSKIYNYYLIGFTRLGVMVHKKSIQPNGWKLSHLAQCICQSGKKT